MDELCRNVSRLCVIMYKFLCSLTLDALSSIYSTLCLPHSPCRAPVWAARGGIPSKVQTSQNKIIRCVLLLGKFDSVNEHISSLSISTFKSIHKYFRMSLIYKTVTSGRANYVFRLVHNSHQTRSSDLDVMRPG